MKLWFKRDTRDTSCYLYRPFGKLVSAIGIIVIILFFASCIVKKNYEIYTEFEIFNCSNDTVILCNKYIDDFQNSKATDSLVFFSFSPDMNIQLQKEDSRLTYVDGPPQTTFKIDSIYAGARHVIYLQKSKNLRLIVEAEHGYVITLKNRGSTNKYSFQCRGLTCLIK